MNYIPVSRPFISREDKAAVMSALENTWISGETPITLALEKKISQVVGVEYSVAISSGTAALDLAVDALDISKGDECIVPSFTIVSTISQLLRRGAKIFLVDSNPDDWSIEPEGIKQYLRSSTKVVLPVHIYGLAANLSKIKEISAEFGTFILEDAAEALGVLHHGQSCGSLGNASILSFYANKIVTGGEGGAFCTNDYELAQKVKSLRNLNFLPGQRFVSGDLGYNSRLGGLSAALINSQLNRLDGLIDRKISLAKRYMENLFGHPWLDFAPETHNGTKNTYWVFPILLNNNCPFGAAEMQHLLESKRIQTRRFFCPMHLQPLTNKFDINFEGTLPVATRLWERGIYLPSGLGITESEIDTVSEILWGLTNESL
jgi:perosamine synthetase